LDDDRDSFIRTDVFCAVSALFSDGILVARE